MASESRRNSKEKTNKMSYSENKDGITKEEWQTRLENFPFKQTNMNKLIMNYLVTGKSHFLLLLLVPP